MFKELLNLIDTNDWLLGFDSYVDLDWSGPSQCDLFLFED